MSLAWVGEAGPLPALDVVVIHAGAGAGAEVTRHGKTAAPKQDHPRRVWYKGGTVRGMAILALEDLEGGEELFLDYRLNTTGGNGRPGKGPLLPR